MIQVLLFCLFHKTSSKPLFIFNWLIFYMELFLFHSEHVLAAFISTYRVLYDEDYASKTQTLLLTSTRKRTGSMRD